MPVHSRNRLIIVPTTSGIFFSSYTTSPAMSTACEGRTLWKYSGATCQSEYVASRSRRWAALALDV